MFFQPVLKNVTEILHPTSTISPEFVLPYLLIEEFHFLHLKDRFGEKSGKSIQDGLCASKQAKAIKRQTCSMLIAHSNAATYLAQQRCNLPVPAPPPDPSPESSPESSSDPSPDPSPESSPESSPDPSPVPVPAPVPVPVPASEPPGDEGVLLSSGSRVGEQPDITHTPCSNMV